MKRIFYTLAFAAAFASSALADTADEIRQRMRDRKEAVAALLATANIGENNAGFLQRLKEASAAEDKTLAEENADRKKVYAAIAKRTGANEADVGKQRAEKIAENAPAGTMVQDAEGAWKQK